MLWKGRRESENVEDRRSMRGPAMAGGGVVGLILMLVVIYLGGDPQALLQPQNNLAGQQGANPEEDERAKFVKVVLGDTEDVWTELFHSQGKTYRKPKLVLFSGRVDSQCGMQGSATGPFYCPVDEQVYIDLSFFNEMAKRFHAPGEFAQAYVIAHEVGHHVQKLQGTSDRVHAQRAGSTQQEGNELSVRMELQADFYAGVWAHHADKKYRILEPGDVEAAMRAAEAIGDDRLQKEARGVVVPESFTHGTSKQRTQWFMRGLKTGDMSQGDTFSIPYKQL